MKKAEIMKKQNEIMKKELERIHQVASMDDVEKEEFCKQHNLPKEAVYAGICGYITGLSRGALEDVKELEEEE